MQEWIAKLFEDPNLQRMGHQQRVDDLNLGLAWLYYGLARVIRPAKAVVIGSYRGFVPMVIAKALADNLEDGRVTFIDPSLVDDFWKDPSSVRAHFARYGITNIDHHLMTTQEFAKSDAYRALDSIGIVFVDGHHSEEQGRFDYETFEPLLAPNGVALFHDTAGYRVSRMHGQRTYRHTIRDYVEKLKLDPDLQVFDVPFGDGVTLVRKRGAQSAQALAQASSA